MLTYTIHPHVCIYFHMHSHAPCTLTHSYTYTCAHTYTLMQAHTLMRIHTHSCIHAHAHFLEGRKLSSVFLPAADNYNVNMVSDTVRGRFIIKLMKLKYQASLLLPAPEVLEGRGGERESGYQQETFLEVCLKHL